MVQHYNSLNSRVPLCNGTSIPCVGFGTWQTPDGETAVLAVKTAIEAGFRHIDTAAIYGNEVSVGQGIKASGVARDELFVTSKVWNSERGYAKTMAAFKKTCRDLGTDYLDLYLIHWPAVAKQFSNWEALNLETWQAMTELYEAGLIKAIGVSNFKPSHLKALQATKVPPMVNQIELHPGLNQEDTVSYCKEHGILVEAWSPLGTGKLLANETLAAVAARYHKSVAQICIRWALQKGVVPLPKSVTPARIWDNAKVFDFELSAQDMALISEMPYSGGSGLDPDLVDF